MVGRWMSLLALLAVVVTSAVSCVSILGDFELVEGTTTPAGTGGSGAQGGGGTGGGEGGSTSALTLSAEPPSLRIVRGSSADLTVTVVRQGPIGDVTVLLSDLPSGVNADPVTIPAAATTGTLTVNAAAGATVGGTLARLGDDGGLATVVDVPLLIADPPGTLDESWDSDGVLSFAPHSGTDDAAAYRATEQADGQLVVAGTLDANSGWVVVRFDRDGSADTAFNASAGPVMPTTGRLWGVTVDPTDGGIVTVGQSENQITVVKLNDDGSADESFGNAGVYRTSSGVFTQGSVGQTAVVQPDGKIVVAGTHTASTPQGVVLRLETNGSVDASFPTLRESDRSLEGVVLDGAGNIVVAGQNSAIGPPPFWVARLTAAGDYDTTFGTGGSVNLGNGQHIGHEVVEQPDGHLVVCGDDRMGAGEGSLGRLTSAGALAWPSPGTIEFDVHGTNDRVYGCASQVNGRILFAGFGGGSPTNSAYVVRLDENGGVDTTFGDQGEVIFEPPGGLSPPQYKLYDVFVMGDGRILAVGNKNDAGWFLVRMWD